MIAAKELQDNERRIKLKQYWKQWIFCIVFIAFGFTDTVTAASLDEQLRVAIKQNRISEVKRLLKKGASRDATFGNGKTAMMHAVERESEEIVRLLLAESNSINSCDKSGRTALMLAVEQRNTSITRLLLEHNATTNISDKKGRTALMSAAKNSDPELVQLLQEYGATTDDPDYKSIINSLTATKDMETSEVMAEIVSPPAIIIEWLSQSSFSFNKDREEIWIDTDRIRIKRMNWEEKSLPYVEKFRVTNPDHNILYPKVTSKDTSIAVVDIDSNGITTLRVVGAGQTEVSIVATGSLKLLEISTMLKDGELSGSIEVIHYIPDDYSIWEVPFKQDIEWIRLTPHNRIIVGRDSVVSGIDLTNGNIVWTSKEFSGIIESFGVIHHTHTPLAIILYGIPRKIAIIDYVNGQLLWDNKNLGLISSMGEFYLPSIRALMIYGEDDEGDDHMVAANLETGDILWDNDNFFGEYDPALFETASHQKTLAGNQLPLLDSDTTMITLMTKSVIRKWDVRKGKLLWKTEIDADKAPALRSRFAPLLLNMDGSIVYVPFDKTIVAIRTHDGSLIWEEQPKLKGNVYQIQPVKQGIIVKGATYDRILFSRDRIVGNQFLTLLDAATGYSVWKEEFKKLKDAAYTNFLVNRDSIFVYSNKKLYAVDIVDGSYREFAKDIEFKGDEPPNYLSLRNGMFLLQSPQNIIMIDENGDKVYHQYFKAPGTSFLLKAAAFTGMVAFNALSGFTIGASLGYYPIITDYNFPRYGSSTTTQNYMYMLTDIKDEEYWKAIHNRGYYGKRPDKSKKSPEGQGLVKLDLNTGKKLSELVLGTKRPIYVIDSNESLIYYILDESKLVCSQF